jgi:hypothetical protein
LAVFIQERVPALDRPGVPGPIAWLGVAAMLLAFALLPYPAAARRPVGTPGLVLLILWGLFSLGRLWTWWERRREWKASLSAGDCGWYAVRFERGSGCARLVGPNPEGAAAAAMKPEAGALPLERVELKEWMSPDHPWSDCVEPDDYVALNLAFRLRGEGLAVDWEGNFDLLEGVEPDHRWYVTAENPEAVRRRRLARELLGLHPG